MSFKVGQRVKVIGRPEWLERGWSNWIKEVGKVGTVKRVSTSNITIDLNGKKFGFFPESLRLHKGQLLFEFMYDKP